MSVWWAWLAGLAVVVSSSSSSSSSSCSETCGPSQTLCRYFCRSGGLQSGQTGSTIYRSAELKEGIEGIFSLLDLMERELSLAKATRPALYQRPKIIGGQEAKEGDFPFIASLKLKNFYRYTHFCGGAAISTSVILTAAHCVAAIRSKSLYVSMGDHQANEKDDFETIIPAERIIMHQQFNPDNFENDIALVKLTHPFRLHTNRQTIRMMRDPDRLQKLLPAAPRLTVLGWGALARGGRGAKILNYVDLPYVEQEACRAAMRPYQVFPGMLCAGDIEKGKVDAFQGDSGGPIVYRVPRTERTNRTSRTFLFEDFDLLDASIFREAADYSPDYSAESRDVAGHDWEIAGLVSWGIGCAQPGYAGIYTNVAFYRDWIERNMP